jgi:hypothetical protein
MVMDMATEISRRLRNPDKLESAYCVIAAETSQMEIFGLTREMFSYHLCNELFITWKKIATLG